MIDINKITSYLDKDFEKYIQEKESHINRVKNAILWFNDVVVDKEIDKISGSMIVINNIKAVCIKNDFRGVPFFECYFIFMPHSSVDDLGNGCGCEYRVDF